MGVARGDPGSQPLLQLPTVHTHCCGCQPHISFAAVANPHKSIAAVANRTVAHTSMAAVVNHTQALLQLPIAHKHWFRSCRPHKHCCCSCQPHTSISAAVADRTSVAAAVANRTQALLQSLPPTAQGLLQSLMWPLPTAHWPRQALPVGSADTRLTLRLADSDAAAEFTESSSSPCERTFASSLRLGIMTIHTASRTRTLGVTESSRHPARVRGTWAARAPPVAGSP
jgi:hypothetical protein